MISPERLDILQMHWIRFLGGLGVEPATGYPPFDRLVAAHSEPHRHYHTLEHVAEMLKVAGRLAKLCANPAVVQFAVWFHDAVYDPTRSDNERRSAELASVELAGIGIDPDVIARVVDLILRTDHRPSPPDPDADVLLDADLAILASGAERYRRYAEAIRSEYAHVPDDAYRTGRTAVLESFLARPRLYRTDVFFREAEAAARKNMANELDRLRITSSSAGESR